MDNKEMLENLVAKLDEVGDDEAAIAKVFEENFEDDGASVELTEADLDDVAGGVFREYEALKWLVNNTKVGKLTWTGTKVCVRCLYDYAKYGNAYKTYSKSYVESLNKEFDKYYKKLPKWLR